MKRPLLLAQEWIKEVLDRDSVALDATMGNGYDTVFLAKHANKVYSFDVQEQALKKTSEQLVANNLTNVELILDGHEHLGFYVKESLQAAMFNLGYLPSADKTLVTKPETTIVAIGQVLERLIKKGRLAIMVYSGHEGGVAEKDAVLTYVSQLPQEIYTVMIYQALNQVNTPPFLIMIEKR